MVQQINSSAELNMVIYNIKKSALELVAKKAVELIKEYVMSEVYQGYTPIGDSLGNYIEQGSGQYGRSMEFANAWGEIDRDVDSIIIGYLENMITSEPSAFIHGSITKNGENVLNPNDLADLIFGGYEVFNSGYQVPSRDAWEKFIRDLEGKIVLWVNEAIK